MKGFFHKPYSWAVVFSVFLISFTTFVLLDTFVIPKRYTKVVDTELRTLEANETEETEDEIEYDKVEEAEAITASSYEDKNIKINIETIKEYDTAIYIADIQITDVAYLKTALAEDTYGRNIKETTSSMAEINNAIFAVNGDFYGFRDDGWVLRNGTLYRDTAGDAQALVIDYAGSFSLFNERETNLAALDLTSIWQILSFGPALIEEGNIIVNSKSEVARSMTSNPRTAIGMIEPLHYIIVVSDGRTVESEGLSLLELAQVLADKGCVAAYNLDGGGSSTMYFNGELVNIPTDGRSFGEREVSDIVYIGY